MSSTKHSQSNRYTSSQYLTHGVFDFSKVEHFVLIRQEFQNRVTHTGESSRSYSPSDYANHYREKILGVDTEQDEIQLIKECVNDLVRMDKGSLDSMENFDQFEDHFHQTLKDYIKKLNYESTSETIVFGFLDIFLDSIRAVVRANQWHTAVENPADPDIPLSDDPHLFGHCTIEKDGKTQRLFYAYIHPHWQEVSWASIVDYLESLMDQETIDYFTRSVKSFFVQKRWCQLFQKLNLEVENEDRKNTMYGLPCGMLLELTPDDETQAFQLRKAKPADLLDHCLPYAIDDDFLAKVQQDQTALWKSMPPANDFTYRYLLEHANRNHDQILHEDINALHQAAGLSLVRKRRATTLKVNKKNFYCYGKPDTAKTSLMDYWMEALGRSLFSVVNANNIFNQGNRFALSPFHCKRFGYIKELKQKHLNLTSETDLKNWAGKEMTSVEHKFKGATDTDDYAQPWIDSNDTPPPNADKGFDNRLHCFHFRTNMIKQLKKDGKEAPSIEVVVEKGEGQLIFLLILNGYYQLWKREDKKVPLTAGHTEVMALRKRVGGDTLRNWLDSCCSIDTDEDKSYRANIQSLRESYKIKLLFGINNRVLYWKKKAETSYKRSHDNTYRKENPFEPVRDTLEFMLDLDINRTYKSTEEKLIRLGTTLEDEGFTSYTDETDTTYFENIRLLKTAKHLVTEKIHQVESITAHDPTHSRVEPGTFERWTMDGVRLEKSFDVHGKTAYLSYQQFCKDHPLKETILNHDAWFQKMTHYKGRYEAYKTIQNGEVVFKQLDFKPYKYDQLQIQSVKNPF